MVNVVGTAVSVNNTKTNKTKECRHFLYKIVGNVSGQLLLY